MSDFIEELANSFDDKTGDDIRLVVKDMITSYLLEYRLCAEKYDDFALWQVICPITLAPIHALKVGYNLIHLSSIQVSLLRALLLDYDEEAPYDHTPEGERAKMTQKLRFQVLARDNYTCQICGAKPSGQGDNAVVLRVDHRFPVSKGGRTELNNLTTLCNECNAGKSDEVRLDLLDPAYYSDPPTSAYYDGMKPTYYKMPLVYNVGQQQPPTIDDSFLGFVKWTLLAIIEKINKFQQDK